jgi:anti-sigma factor RsiW
VTRCDDAALLLGSYVLGGLDASETAQVEEHLATCDGCRQEHARIAALPGLLELLEPGEPTGEAPPARLEGAVLAGFAAERRGDAAMPRRIPRRGAGRLRWPVASAAALAGAVATLLVLALAGAFSSGPAETRVTLRAQAGAPAGATATAWLAPTAEGMAVELVADLPKLQRGEIYELWFGRKDGATSAGTFTVDGEGRAEVRLTSAARPGAYERMGITREPDGIDPARNGPVVVAGLLPG